MARKPRALNLSKEVLVFKKGSKLALTPERRAIRWLGELRRILMDPSLAGPDDLFSQAQPADHARWRKMNGFKGKASTLNRRKKKKAEDQARW